MRLSQLQQDFTEIPKSIDPTDTPVNVDVTTSISIRFVKKKFIYRVSSFPIAIYVYIVDGRTMTMITFEIRQQLKDKWLKKKNGETIDNDQRLKIITNKSLKLF